VTTAIRAGASGARISVRNQGIDLLRGLSIFLVILNHIGLRIPFIFLCWLLGWTVAKYFSIPLDRKLRQRLLKPARSA